MRTMTASTLALAVSLGLGSAAFAGEGNKHKDQHAKHQPPEESSMAHAHHDGSSGKHSTAVRDRVGEREHDRLVDGFRQLDRDDDGTVLIADLDSAVRSQLAMFDADDDQRLDRYEFEMARSARFQDLDRDNDDLLSRSELEPIKPEYVTFVALDVDNDQHLSRQEYQQFILSGDWVQDRDRYAFAYIDRDRSGNVDNQEASIYRPLASTFTAYDPDGDGRIEATEYEVFLTEVDRRQRGNRVASGDDIDQDDMGQDMEQ